MTIQSQLEKKRRQRGLRSSVPKDELVEVGARREGGKSDESAEKDGTHCCNISD
jgi:hypothetical protein